MSPSRTWHGMTAGGARVNAAGGWRPLLPYHITYRPLRARVTGASRGVPRWVRPAPSSVCSPVCSSRWSTCGRCCCGPGERCSNCWRFPWSCSLSASCPGWVVRVRWVLSQSSAPHALGESLGSSESWVTPQRLMPNWWVVRVQSKFSVPSALGEFLAAITNFGILSDFFFWKLTKTNFAYLCSAILQTDL